MAQKHEIFFFNMNENKLYFPIVVSNQQAVKIVLLVEYITVFSSTLEAQFYNVAFFMFSAVMFFLHIT